MKADCCAGSINGIQELEGVGNFLQFVLKASPYIILIPSLGSGVLNEGVRRGVSKQIIEMSAAKAVEKVTAAGKLPDVNDAVKSVHGIVRNKLIEVCRYEMIRHSTGAECAFWNKLHNLYSLKNNGAPASEPGWFSWW